jgi:hypothetical protein
MEPQWPGKADLARLVCDAADESGCDGEQWGTMAHSFSLYFDLTKAICAELSKLGYRALPKPLRGNQEACRVEGADVIVVVQRVLESDRQGKWLCYDLEVYCRQLGQRPIIAAALDPIVKDYGAKDKALIDAYRREPRAEED